MLPPRIAWTVVVLTILCRSALSTILALLLWGVLPGLAGFPTTVVMSGSMAPQLQVGDAVVTRTVDGGHLAVGQVLLFDDPDHAERLRLHRLAAVDDEGRLWTRGDANPARDSSSVRLPAVHGAAFLRIPFAGLPVYWLRTGQPLPLAASALLVVVLLAGVRLGRALEDPEERDRRRHRGARLPAVHRAVAAGAVLLVVSGLVPPSQEAHAAYSAVTRNTGSSWGTACGDRTPGALPAGAALYWGYGSGTGTAVPDLSGRGAAGVTAGDATRVGCTGGAGPSIAVGGSGGGGVIEQAQRSYPGDTTVATWFRTSTPGGVLADFGSSNTSASSASIDRVLYMRSDGSITFGNVATQAAGVVLSTLTCTSAGGLADGRWHLVVATWSISSGCTITIDDGAAVTASPTIALSLLSGYSGYWRFGYDGPSTLIWPGATPRFVGGLDESQVYSTVLGASARAAILARGR